jgi:hypothetical protein
MHLACGPFALVMAQFVPE